MKQIKSKDKIQDLGLRKIDERNKYFKNVYKLIQKMHCTEIKWVPARFKYLIFKCYD